MLRGLSIRNFVLIDSLDLSFQPGLNVLTGETGAGKSILLDALGFSLGERGRGAQLRAGASTGEVAAEFELPADHPVWEIVADAGHMQAESLILRRVLSGDSRSRAFVNDRRCGVELLRQLGEALIEVHGQQDDRGLLDARQHGHILDSFGGLDNAVSDVRGAWTALSEAKSALDVAREARDAAARDEDFLRHAVAELTAFDPVPDEDQTLDSQRRLLQAAERIRSDVERAAMALGPSGSEGQLSDARRWLEDVVPEAEGQLDDALSAIERAMTELGEAQMQVETMLGRLRVDPGELETVEERLFALRALSRKHRVAPDSLPVLSEELSARLAAIDGGTAHLAELEAAVESAKAAYDTRAAQLSAKRHEAATRLDAAMADELAPLKLDGARFKTEVTPGPDGPRGRDKIAFQIATNPGAPFGALNRIASGGELSRFLLAMKVCLAGTSEGVAMIFDEIDRGVGGATADAVGRRLSQLAEQSQVLVVTHSPQVAAQGDHHWRIAKDVEDGMTRTRVTPIGPEAREAELARMLAGEVVTDEARAAARALLAG